MVQPLISNDNSPIEAVKEVVRKQSLTSKEEVTMEIKKATRVVTEDGVLETMVQQAEEGAKAVEPGTLIPGQVLEGGGEDTPPTIVGSLTSAGYVYIYNTRSGEQSITNRNMLPTQLKKHFTDGAKERVFTLVEPAVKPRRGTIKCILHPDQPWRAHYDEVGFPTCMKANIMNPHQQTMHMKHRHKEEYATILAEQAAEEKEQTRRFQQAFINQQQPS